MKYIIILLVAAFFIKAKAQDNYRTEDLIMSARGVSMVSTNNIYSLPTDNWIYFNDTILLLHFKEGNAKPKTVIYLIKKRISNERDSSLLINCYNVKAVNNVIYRDSVNFEAIPKLVVAINYKASITTIKDHLSEPEVKKYVGVDLSFYNIGVFSSFGMDSHSYKDKIPLFLTKYRKNIPIIK